MNIFEVKQLFKLKQIISYGRLANGVNKNRILASVQRISTPPSTPEGKTTSPIIAASSPCSQNLDDNFLATELRDLNLLIEPKDTMLKNHFFTLVWSGIV